MLLKTCILPCPICHTSTSVLTLRLRSLPHVTAPEINRIQPSRSPDHRLDRQYLHHSGYHLHLPHNYHTNHKKQPRIDARHHQQPKALVEASRI